MKTGIKATKEYVVWKEEVYSSDRKTTKKNETVLIQVDLIDIGAYFIYRINNVQRGIKGKSRGQVDEIIAVGVPRHKLQKYCVDNEIIITNQAVYLNNDMSKPYLVHIGGGNYGLRNDAANTGTGQR